MSVYVVPFFIIFVLLYSSYKNLNTYNIFVKGAKGALDLVVSIFPYIVAIMISVSLMRISGLTYFFTYFISPVFTFLGIPSQVSELVLLRPVAGSGSFALLNEIFIQYGADSYISRCACVIMGSSETVFYVATVYFSQTKVKKLLYAIPCALVCSFVSAVVSCLLCRII